MIAETLGTIAGLRQRVIQLSQHSPATSLPMILDFGFVSQNVGAAESRLTFAGAESVTVLIRQTQVSS